MKNAMTNKRTAVILLVVVALAAVTTLAWAALGNKESGKTTYDNTVILDVDHPIYATIDELKKDADYIFIGTVKGDGIASLENARPEDDLTDPTPFTEYTVEVEETIKGQITDKTIVFRQLGGVNDNTKYMVEGYPILEDGQQYIFFAIEGDGKYGALAGGYAVAKIEDGRFTVSEQTGIYLLEPVDISSIK